MHRAVGRLRRLAFARSPSPTAGAPARRSRRGLRTVGVDRCIELSAACGDSRSLAPPRLRRGPRLAACAAASGLSASIDASSCRPLAATRVRSLPLAYGGGPGSPLAPPLRPLLDLEPEVGVR